MYPSLNIFIFGVIPKICITLDQGFVKPGHAMWKA